MDEGLAYRGSAATGFPSPASDYLERPIDLATELVKDKEATFVMEMRSDAMINAFIPPKAWIVIDRSLTPHNGSIVLAVVNGEWMLRFLKMNRHKKWLVPANSKYKEIEITPGLDMELWGVATFIVTNTQNLAACMR